MLLRTTLRAVSAWLIWRWLEPRWRSTLALVIGWLLVTVLHNEYAEYVRISENTGFLWLSYLLKWLLILSGIAAYAWFSVLAPRQPARHGDGAAATAKSPDSSLPPDDGFDFLRHKNTLSSRADKVIDRAATAPSKSLR